MANPEVFNHELMTLGKLLAEYGWLSIGILAFTVRQREYIKDRDNHTCQHPDCRNRKNQRLEVHHIIPQRYAKEIGIDPDFETNGLTLCKDCHSRVHPDRQRALKGYHRDKNVFERLKVDRDALLRQKQIYWDATWDRIFTTTAVRNSQRFLRQDPTRVFPPPNETRKAPQVEVVDDGLPIESQKTSM